MIYNHLLRPAMFALWPDAEEAHEAVMKRLRAAGEKRWLSGLVSSATRVKSPHLQRELFGVRFPNPIGLAGGFDKNAVAIHGFEMLGFGFLEIGTVTWHPQPGNDRPRVFRYPKDAAIINRFGFNNEGARAMAARLAADTRPRTVPLGISLGKSKITPIEEAVTDYLASFRELYTHGDYFAVNVSSPNTPGLRQLQDKSALDDLLASLDEEGRVLERKLADADHPQTRARKPILVKIAPDLEPQALDELLDVCTRRHVDGLIATNTTLSRDGLNTTSQETGGMSGRPLFPRSIAIVRHIRRQLPDIPLIGVGGIMTPQNACDMLDAGADLLQIYTGLIYNGPLFPARLNRAIVRHTAAQQAV